MFPELFELGNTLGVEIAPNKQKYIHISVKVICFKISIIFKYICF